MPIADDARDHALLESGFEVVTLQPPGILDTLARLGREGLSGAESPGAAVSTGPLEVLSQMLGGGTDTLAADSALARALEGSAAYALRDVLFAHNLRCSGLIVRRSGPRLMPPIDTFASHDGSGGTPEDATARRAAADGAAADEGGESADVDAWPEPLGHSGDTRLPAYTPHVDQDTRGEPLRSMGLSWLFSRVPFVRLLN
eukprot:6932868-Prymnesium_polylepis.1